MFKTAVFIIFIVALIALIFVLFRLDRRYKKLDKELPSDVKDAIKNADAAKQEDAGVKVILGDKEPKEYLKEHSPKRESSRIHIRSKDGVYSFVLSGKPLTELLNGATREGAFDSYTPTITLTDKVERLWMQDLVVRRGIWMPLLAQNGILGNNSVQVLVEEDGDSVVWRKFSYYNDPETEIEMPEICFDKKQYKTFQDTFKLYSERGSTS